MGATSSTAVLESQPKGSSPNPAVHVIDGDVFANLPTSASPPAEKEVVHCLPDHPKYFAMTVSNVFTPEECDALLKLSEQKGYEPALLNVGYGQQVLATDVRNNDRCIIDSVDLAALVWERIKEYVPHHIEENRFADHHVPFEAISVNERFRFLRYGPGMEFKRHYDGSFVRTDKSSPNYGDQSLLTLQIYLNDVEKGGETTFFMNPHDEKDPGIGIKPRKGMIILFQHNILHSGSPVLAGQKYCIRTDIMYRPIRTDFEKVPDAAPAAAAAPSSEPATTENAESNDAQ